MGRISQRTRQAHPKHTSDRLVELALLHDLEFSNPAVKLLDFFFFFPFLAHCSGLCVKSCGHCEGLFNYCYVKPEQLLHLLILTNGASTVLFCTGLFHWCEMIALHG